MRFALALAFLLLASAAHAQMGTPPTGSGNLGTAPSGTPPLGTAPTGSGNLGTTPSGGSTLGVTQGAPAPVRPTLAPRGGGGVPLSEIEDPFEFGLPNFEDCLTLFPRALSCLWK